MSEQVGEGLVPELRFPEFLGLGEWSAHTVGDFVESHKGGAPLKPKDFVSYSGYEVIPKKAIGAGGWLQTDVEGRVYCTKGFYNKNPQSVIDSSYLVTTLRDLVPSGPSIGYIVKYTGDKKYLLAQGVYGLKPKKLFISDFLIHFSNTGQYRKLVNSAMVGSTQVHIRNGEFLKLPIKVPLAEEQQKIADCLSSVDSLIISHNQKYEALKVHKKSLLQLLFSREDEVAPSFRFPEFRGTEEWIELKLGEITDFSSGGTPSKDIPEFWDGEIPWISASSMHDTCLDKSDHNITQLAVDKGARTVPKGTVLLLVRGSMLHKRIPVGITALDVAFNQDVKALSLKKDVLERFMLCLIVANERRLLGAVTKTGIGAGKLDTNDLKDFLVRIPADIKEQQKIADCLSSIDDLITAQSQKIESLKAHKKGLMQQLFPAIDEVNT